MMRGLVIATNGDMRVQTFTAPALEDVQKVVGGYVETVPVRNIEGHYLLMVDEDARLQWPRPAMRGKSPNASENERYTMKFYFTYSSSGMAYEGGWTEVEAPSRATAMQAFSAFHRPVNGMTACPDIYTEEAFRKTGMLDGGNFGAKTREKITITRELF